MDHLFQEEDLPAIPCSEHNFYSTKMPDTKILDYFHNSHLRAFQLRSNDSVDFMDS